MGREVVVDLDAGLGEQLARPLEARARHADRHAGDKRAGVVERLHHAGESALGFDLGAAEQVVLGDAAVLEAEVGGVGRPDPELVLEPLEDQPRVVALDHERLDRRAPLLAVERGPDHDQLGAVAGGDEDLLAVQHVLGVGGSESSSSVAVVRIAAESDPASGSVIAIAAHLPPNRFSCSSFATAAIAAWPRP